MSSRITNVNRCKAVVQITHSKEYNTVSRRSCKPLNLSEMVLKLQHTYVLAQCGKFHKPLTL